MFDLQVLAWQADITRVTTLLLAKELSNAVYPKSGVRDAFHILSHHSNIRENQDRFAVLNRYHVGLLDIPARQAAGHAGRRRHVAGSFDGAVRQRAWATATSTITIRCRSSWPAAHRAR